MAKNRRLQKMRVGNSTVSSRFYRFDETGQTIEIAPTVLEKFTRNQQASSRAAEAGGLLFASISARSIQISSATEPTNSDIRSRFFFKSSRSRAKASIKQGFKDGLHFVGEWHTHPEPNPTPSKIDLDSMAQSFRSSKHQLEHFVMIIVGNDKNDMRLWVSIHNDVRVLRLSEVCNESNQEIRPETST